MFNVRLLRGAFHMKNIYNSDATTEGTINTSLCNIFGALASLTRIRMYNLLAERKCLSFSELMKELNVKSAKHLRYHLDIMKKARIIEEKVIRFSAGRKKKQKKYFYLNFNLKLTVIDSEKPMLEISVNSDRLTEVIARFEEQSKKKMIPREVTQEMIDRIRIAKGLKNLKNKISDVKYRA